MLAKTGSTTEIRTPVAIFDRDLGSLPAFTTQIMEMCTMCGACFGIGYQGESVEAPRLYESLHELPGRLREILAKDHRQNREHKRLIHLDAGEWHSAAA